MKKGLILMILAIVAIEYISCDKPEKVKDYRDKWVGTYECKKCYGAGYVDYVDVDVQTKKDSLLYIAERNLDPYRAGVKYDMKINIDGIFQNIDPRPPFISGNFYEDSLYIFYFYPTPGAGVSVSYEGKKRKSK